MKTQNNKVLPLALSLAALFVKMFQVETSATGRRLARMTVPHKWLLLLYGLPTRQSAERVSLWRKLKKFGALQLKTSAYVLPDQPLHFERFQWLAKQVRDDGGEAALIRVSEIEGLRNEEIARLFNDARAEDYGALIKSTTAFIQR